MATALGRHCGGEVRGVAAAGEGGRGAMGARGGRGMPVGMAGERPGVSPSLP